MLTCFVMVDIDVATTTDVAAVDRGIEVVAMINRAVVVLNIVSNVATNVVSPPNNVAGVVTYEINR